MRYKLLGRSGLRVSELCLGTMTFGEEWGWGAGREESRKIFDAFVDRGGNFLDTANKYTDGTSERFVGELVSPERERFVVATKYTLTMNPDDPNASGSHRKNMVQALEASLERLGTDYIDLYWVHFPDRFTPVEEILRALDDMVRAGKILYVGISDAPAWWVARANTMADLRGWTPFVALQIEYSLIARTPERELLPMAQALDLAVTPWGTLGGGVLSGKYLTDEGRADAARADMNQGRLAVERNFEIARATLAVAEEIGCTPSQVATNWVRQRRGGVIIPILGARKVSQIEDNLGALDFELGEEHLSRLDQASSIELGFPHDFVNLESIKQIIYGDKLDLIDDHRARD